MFWARGLPVALVLLLACPAEAETPSQRYLESAGRLFESLEYERALEHLARAKAEPHSLTEDVSIALYEGIIYAELRRDEEAVAAFKAALFLEPQAALPIEVSPKVRELFLQTQRTTRRTGAAAPLLTSAPEAARPGPLGHPSLARRWAWAPAAAGLLLTGAGSFFLVQSADYSSRLAGRGKYQGLMLSPDEAQALRDGGKSFHWLGLGSVALGSALLATGAGLYFLAAPTSNQPLAGWALALGGSFP